MLATLNHSLLLTSMHTVCNAGVFGVGGGAIMVPAIALATDYTHKEALGLSLAAMVLPAVAGGVVHYRAGNLLPRIVVPLAVGTAAGAYFGSTYVVQHLSNEHLKYAFAVFMGGLGLKTLRSAGPLKQRVAAAAAVASKGAKAGSSGVGSAAGKR